MATNHKPTIAGEWTGAMTDCAKWLNGLGVGARYDGSLNDNGLAPSWIGSCDTLYQGSIADVDLAYVVNMKKYIEAQMDAFERAGGWIWWTWKTEGAPEWDMRELLQAGVINTPVTSRTYPRQCDGGSGSSKRSSERQSATRSRTMPAHL